MHEKSSVKIKNTQAKLKMYQNKQTKQNYLK